MKRIALALFALAAFGASAGAQVIPPGTNPVPAGGAYNSTPPTCVNGSACWLQVDVNGQLKVTGSFSSSTTGFPTIQSTGTPISVTTGGVTGTLPTGAVVVASNVGSTNGAFCKLGASATTSDQLIPPNSWFAFTVGANTQLTCITSTSTTTVNMVGGSGLPTGSGGGGGGSGGTSNITQVAGTAVNAGVAATGALPIDTLATGNLISAINAGAAPVAAGAATATTSALTGCQYLSTQPTLTNTQQMGTPCSPRGAAYVVPGVEGFAVTVSGVATAAGQTGDPCSLAALKVNLPITSNTSALTQIIAASGSTKIYVCSLALISASAEFVTFNTGTGTNCGTGTAGLIGGTTVGTNGLSLPANGGLTLGNGAGTIAVTGAGGEVCVALSGTTYVTGNLTYVQQ